MNPWDMYPKCEGCYRTKSWNVPFTKVAAFVQGGIEYSSQILCPKCYEIFIESYIDYQKYERWSNERKKEGQQ